MFPTLPLNEMQQKQLRADGSLHNNTNFRFNSADLFVQTVPTFHLWQSERIEDKIDTLLQLWRYPVQWFQRNIIMSTKI